MQYQFSCLPPVLTAIEQTLSPERITRYLPANSTDRNHALRTYLWNAHLCEQFVIPIQFAEICVRNMLNRALERKFGTQWHRSAGLLSPLPQRLKDDVTRSLRAEEAQHGPTVSASQLVSALSFGFWVHLTTKKSIGLIWGGSLPTIFPCAPKTVSDTQIYSKLDQLRKFRNRVAHHNAIFDRGPVSEYRNIQDIVGWSCDHTLWLMRETANPATVINQRPQV